MKTEQKHKNTRVVFMVDKWFQSHTVMTKDNYDMLREMVYELDTSKTPSAGYVPRNKKGVR